MTGTAPGARYRLLRPIKRGGTAEVFEALLLGDDGFERRVALKRLLAEIGGDESFVRSFSDEARIAGQLHHSGIAPVIDYGVADDRPFLVMEWIDGPDLRELLDRTTLPLPLALFVATEIAHALRHAHRATDRQKRPLRIVHRDVSPENILVSWEGDVKLTDFGIAFAKRRIEETRVGVTKGRLAYMPPEQLRGDEVDGRADVYALGCVLHEAVSGRTPFGEDPLGPAKLDDSLPPDVAEIVERATRKLPKERWANAEDLGAALGRALAKRLSQDARTAMREWLAANIPAPEPAPELDPPVELFAAVGSKQYRSKEIESADALNSGSLEGQALQSYRLHELLGRGSSAHVYRATHVVFDREYAIKVLDKQFSRDQRSIERFRREAEILGRLAHPNIVSVFDFGELPDGRTFLVLERVLGRSLRDVILKEAPIDPRRAANLGREIAIGLAAAHAQGVLHRDLKPANVRVIDGPDGAERVKILDFGIARKEESDLTRLTVPGRLLGTPAYLSPEQIRAVDTGPPADLYSLGVILFELIAGQRPFRGSVTEVLEAQLEKAAPPAPAAGGLEVWVDRLLAKDPALRPSARELIEAFEVFSAQESTAPLRTRVTEVEPRPDHTTLLSGVVRAEPVRAVWPWMLAGVLVLVVAAGAGGFMLRGTRPANEAEVQEERPRELAAKAAATATIAEVATATEADVSADEPAEVPEAPAAGEGGGTPRPAPRPRHRPKPAPEVAPAPSVAPQLAALEKKIGDALAAAGVTQADLDAGGKTAFAAFRRARGAKELPAAQAAAEAVAAAAARCPAGPALLKARLSRVGDRLEAARAQLGEDDRLALEKRYLDLMARAGPRLDAAAAASLSRQALELEDEIAKKTR